MWEKSDAFFVPCVMVRQVFFLAANTFPEIMRNLVRRWWKSCTASAIAFAGETAFIWRRAAAGILRVTNAGAF